MILIDKIRGSFAKVFDEAKPSSVDALRRRCVSAAQRQTLEKILADWRELGAKCHDYTRPSKRLEVLLWHHGASSLDALPEDTARAVERACIEGDQREILHQDAMLRERAGPIIQRARDAVRDLHRSLLPGLRSELEKARALVSPLYEAYACDPAGIDEIEPIRRILRSIADSEHIAENGVILDGGHIESELPAWL